jgi:diphthine methyl ester acylhydrolase
MRICDTKVPIDSLASSNEFLIAGGYQIEEGVRSGKVSFYGRGDSINHELETSGTLDVEVSSGCVYLANSEDVGVVELQSKTHIQRTTESINTYVSAGSDFIAISSLDGSIYLYGKELELMEKMTVSVNPVWVTEVYEGQIVSGCEGGSLSFSDARTGRIHRVLQRGCGVTSIHAMNEYLYVGSYDECIEVIDRRTHKVVSRACIGGGVWRILSIGGCFYVACMYEGLKVFSEDFKILRRYYTASIVYAVAVHGCELAFASFYDQKLYITDISDESF